MSQRNKSPVVSVQVLEKSILPALLVLQCSCPWHTLAELALDFMCPLTQDTREELMRMVTCGNRIYKLFP